MRKQIYCRVGWMLCTGKTLRQEVRLNVSTSGLLNIVSVVGHVQKKFPSPGAGASVAGDQQRQHMLRGRVYLQSPIPVSWMFSDFTAHFWCWHFRLFFSSIIYIQCSDRSINLSFLSLPPFISLSFLIFAFWIQQILFLKMIKINVYAQCNTYGHTGVVCVSILFFSTYIFQFLALFLYCFPFLPVPQLTCLSIFSVFECSFFSKLTVSYFQN